MFMYTVNHYNVNRLKEYIDIQTKLRFYWKIIYIHFQENYFFGNNIRNRKNCWQPFFPVPCTCLLLHSPRCAAASPPRPAPPSRQRSHAAPPPPAVVPGHRCQARGRSACGASPPVPQLGPGAAPHGTPRGRLLLPLPCLLPSFVGRLGILITV